MHPLIYLACNTTHSHGLINYYCRKPLRCLYLSSHNDKQISTLSSPWTNNVSCFTYSLNLWSVIITSSLVTKLFLAGASPQPGSLQCISTHLLLAGAVIRALETCCTSYSHVLYWILFGTKYRREPIDLRTGTFQSCWVFTYNIITPYPLILTETLFLDIMYSSKAEIRLTPYQCRVDKMGGGHQGDGECHELS